MSKAAAPFVRLLSVTIGVPNGNAIALDCYEANRVCLCFDYQGKSATSFPTLAVQWLLSNGVTAQGVTNTANSITAEVYTFPAPGNNVHEIFVLEFVCPPAARQFVALVKEAGDAGNPGVVVIDGALAAGT